MSDSAPSVVVLIDASHRVVRVGPLELEDGRLWRVLVMGGQVIPMSAYCAERIRRGMWMDVAAWEHSPCSTCLLRPHGVIVSRDVLIAQMHEVILALDAGGAVLRLPDHVPGRRGDVVAMPQPWQWRLRTYAQVRRDSKVARGLVA